MAEQARVGPAFLWPLPAPIEAKLTFIVEEAAIHQDEPALVPLLDPGAGLWDTWRQTGGDRELGTGGGMQGKVCGTNYIRTSCLWLRFCQ